jgi:pimeloyl-ACP methyl ester carboxylesterase
VAPARHNSTVAHSLDRRLVLKLLAAAATVTVAPRGFAETAPVAGFREILVHAPGYEDVAELALVLVPDQLDPSATHPAVVLLHGYPQALQKQSVAVRAWDEHFAVTRAYQRLATPPVRPIYPRTQYLTPEHQQQLNESLLARPFQGLVLVCPYTPSAYFQGQFGSVFQRYAEWLEQSLLPAVRAQAPVSPEARHLALCGVSMGGHVGLEVLWRKPELFGAFSGVQIAIDRTQAAYYAKRLSQAFQRVGSRPVQVLAGSGDRYRWADEALHRSLLRMGHPSEFQVPPGAHTSEWMRELGSLEALLWADRTLHG